MLLLCCILRICFASGAPLQIPLLFTRDRHEKLMAEQAASWLFSFSRLYPGATILSDFPITPDFH